MQTQILSEFALPGDTTVRYMRSSANGRVGMLLIPTSMTPELATRRTGIGHEPYIAAMPGAGNPPAVVVDPLVHLKLVGDPYGGCFSQGRTLRAGPSNDRFRYRNQTVNGTSVLTRLESQDGLRLEHELSWKPSDGGAASVHTRFINDSDRPVALELLTSFSVGGITPFHPADAPGRLRVHRFRSGWSAEGRHEMLSIEQLHLERSWSGSGQFSERFGQVGSMPVRGWFPFVAVEDVPAGVIWGANLAWAGSWQMEVFRQHDDVCISGGLADREFGHWVKTIRPGETFQSPAATIACVGGDLDLLCERLTAPQHRAVDVQPPVEQDLPIVFNEWCTTWGDPRHDRVVAIADRLRGSDVKYLVIDAGWYKTDRGDWGTAHGDWIPSRNLFPQGLEATASAIRERGLIPGLWFEMENVGDQSEAFSMHVDKLLHRDGLPLTVRHRRFWNLNDPRAVEYLSDRVIGLLERCGFGYLKVDYNETIGVGCDGAESQGEGLRRQIDGVHRFFDRIRTRLPDLVIENCSSGGHRLEPSMLARTAMSSFSDAHELPEIPIIAANLHRLMLPRQSQIWAVLHPTDTDARLTYSLAATFLGRMCLSGDIVGLSQTQWRMVREAMSLYRRVTPIIKHGQSRRFGEMGASWRHPTGWQAVLRTDSRHALVVVHAFAEAPQEVDIPLPAGQWAILAALPAAERLGCTGAMKLNKITPFTARVFLLHRID